MNGPNEDEETPRTPFMLAMRSYDALVQAKMVQQSKEAHVDMLRKKLSDTKTTQMTKKQFLERIKDAHDDAVVVVPAADHSYRAANVSVTTALFDVSAREFSEDCGEELTPEADYGIRVPIIVIQ